MADASDWYLLAPWNDRVALVRLSEQRTVESIRFAERTDIELLPMVK